MKGLIACLMLLFMCSSAKPSCVDDSAVVGSADGICDINSICDGDMDTYGNVIDEFEKIVEASGYGVVDIEEAVKLICTSRNIMDSIRKKMNEGGSDRESVEELVEKLKRRLKRIISLSDAYKLKLLKKKEKEENSKNRKAAVHKSINSVTASKNIRQKHKKNNDLSIADEIDLMIENSNGLKIILPGQEENDDCTLYKTNKDLNGKIGYVSVLPEKNSGNKRPFVDNESD